MSRLRDGRDSSRVAHRGDGVPASVGGSSAVTDAPSQAPRSGNRLNPVVFAGSLVGILAVALWALMAPTHARDTLGVVVTWAAGWFGWFYIALATLVVAFVLFLGASRYGRIRLGPDHSRPQFSTFSWAAMLFAAGIGTDLMFFSVAEPVTQYLRPPRGTGGTIAAAEEATAWTLFHYGISGWAMYSLMGMSLAYFAYRRHRPLAVRSVLEPIFGAKVMSGRVGDVVDIAAMVGTVFGVATSLGIGVVQLNVGLKILFDIDQGIPAQSALVVIAVVMAAVSATTGVDKGIRLLSQINVLLAVALAAWVLVTGKTQFLLNALVMNIGGFVTGFPSLTGQTFAYDQPIDWMAAWTLFFWAWWIAWASFVGLFLARISQGRTIREFVVGTLVLPFSYIVMWVSIFGNSAIDRIRGGDAAFGEATLAAPEQGFYTLLQQYPAPTFLVGVATFVGLLFYVTSADSGALVLANLSSRLDSAYDDGKPWLRILWAAVTGLLTIAMLMVGGIAALQNATVIMGLPFAFVMLLVIVGLWKALRSEGRRAESARGRIPRMFAGRGGADVDGALATTWKARLGRALTAVDDAEAVRYLDAVIDPSLREVAAELDKCGVAATVDRHVLLDAQEGGRAPHVELRVDSGPDRKFVYRVELGHVPVAVYGGRMAKAGDLSARLEVHDAHGGQGYDVMGYSSAQLIHDVLDQYERHLEFVRLEEEVPATV